MDREFIGWILKFAKDAGIAELEYSEGEVRLKIISGLPSSIPASTAAVPKSATSSVVSPVEEAAQPPHKIFAGATGLFYRSQTPGGRPFVAVGDLVNEGDTLGILEAMKMLTPIESDRAGLVVEILVGDGETIATGTPLFVLGSPQ